MTNPRSSLPRRRVLIVSPHFPPVNAPDHQRVRMSLPFLAEFGWTPDVLCVAAEAIEAPRDDLLAATLPADVDVHRVRALSPRLTRRFGIGNLGYRSWLPLRRRGDQLLRQGSFDLVYFSTTVFIATTLGRHWLARFGVPYVVDVQDPWRTDYYDRPGAPPPPGGWKYRWARRQASRLEERAWRHAAGFVSVSPEYLRELESRYDWFAKRPAAVIPFGASEADFALIQQRPDIEPAFVREPGVTHIVSVGALGPIMRPALQTFFRGLAAWRARHPEAGRNLRVHFVGTSYAPGARAVESARSLALEFGVADLVTEQTARLGFLNALQTLVAADAIFLPGSDAISYSPSKIAQVYLARRPVLALVPASSVVARQLDELCLTPFVVPPGGRTADAQIADFIAQLKVGSRPLMHAGAEAVFRQHYTARATTAQQCALFERALAFHAGGPSIRA